MSEQLSWKQVLQINAEFAKAGIGFGVAWVFWEMAGPGYGLFKLYALIFAIGGAKCLVVALWKTVMALLRMRKWARYKSQGTDPKADPFAKEDTLKKQGLLK